VFGSVTQVAVQSLPLCRPHLPGILSDPSARRRSVHNMLISVAAAVIAFASSTSATHSGSDSLMGTGVSRTLATARAAQIRDVRYELMLNLTERDSANGTVTVRFKVAKPSDVILDFRGQRLGKVSSNGKPLESLDYNGAHLRVPAAAIVAGENQITIAFVTKIAAAGASIIRYRDATDGSEYLYTLLVPADANQLFPCFDQPDLKARVKFIAIAPNDWRVLGLLVGDPGLQRL